MILDKSFNEAGPPVRFDEKNTPRRTRLLVNTGGGSEVTGQVDAFLKAVR